MLLGWWSHPWLDKQSPLALNSSLGQGWEGKELQCWALPGWALAGQSQASATSRKSPSGHNSPAGGHPRGPCTGHCFPPPKTPPPATLWGSWRSQWQTALTAPPGRQPVVRLQTQDLHNRLGTADQKALGLQSACKAASVGEPPVSPGTTVLSLHSHTSFWGSRGSFASTPPWGVLGAPIKPGVRLSGDRPQGSPQRTEPLQGDWFRATQTLKANARETRRPPVLRCPVWLQGHPWAPAPHHFLPL